MARNTNITCVCQLEVADADEYEALQEVVEMI